MLVIGKNPILEILRNTPEELNKIILLKRIKPEPNLKEIVDLSKEKRINTIFLNDRDFAKYFNRKNKSQGISQGVLGFIKDYQYTTLNDIVEGAIARSAVCLGADGIIIPRHNSADVNHTVLKTSSGAVKYISIAKETNLSNSIRYLKDNGYWIVGTDIKADKNTFETDFKKPIGLIIGSEGKGMRKNIKEQCDIFVRIPMAGKLDSLNASVSAGVILYEIFRQKNS